MTLCEVSPALSLGETQTFRRERLRIELDLDGRLGLPGDNHLADTADPGERLADQDIRVLVKFLDG